MLRRKLVKARTSDELLVRLESAASATEAAHIEAQKRGRELMRTQKEQQRALANGGSREESAKKLTEVREDLRIQKERLRVRKEQNEADGQQIVLAEKRCADLVRCQSDRDEAVNKPVATPPACE